MTRLAALLAVLLMFVAAPAAAMDAENPQAPKSEKSTADLLSDLDGDEAPDRLYAARVLRGQLRRALRTEARGRVGSIPYEEARALLLELDLRLPEACTSALQFENTVGPCADMLAWLQVRDALPKLRERRAAEERKRVQKRLDAAIATLEALPPAPPG